MKTRLLVFAASAALSLTAMAANQTPQPAGGVVVIDGKAYILSRLQTEMSMPAGGSIRPDGTVQKPDGQTAQIPSGQMMTFDGKIAPAPAGLQQAPSGANTEDGASNGTSNVESASASISNPGAAQSRTDKPPYHQEKQPGVDQGTSPASTPAR